MALDPTARESNFKDSIKKHFTDNVENALNVPLMFDQSLSIPKVQGREVGRWLKIHFGEMTTGRPLSHADVTLRVCTKKDPEGFKLAQLRDKVLGTLFSAEGHIAIPLYQSHPTNPWVIIGYMKPSIVWQSGTETANDETKFRSILVNFKWGTVI